MTVCFDYRLTHDNLMISLEFIRKHHADKKSYPIILMTDEKTQFPSFQRSLGVSSDICPLPSGLLPGIP